MTGSNLTCNGNGTGTITASQIGGTGGFSYSWSNLATTSVQNGLSSGTYVVTVTDANGCTSSSSINLNQPQLLTVNIIGFNLTCNGNASGSVSPSVSGGTSPFIYNWSNSATTSALSGLQIGTYNVTVSDANGCTAVSNDITLTQPAILTFTTSQINVTTCYNNNNGSITITSVTGGTSGYSYSNDGGNNYQGSTVFSNLTGGNYSVVVKDVNNCIANSSVIITTPAVLAFTPVVNSVSCNGGNNGSIVVTASGGATPYNYSDNNGSSYQLSAVFNNLSIGTYPVIVKDANNCLSSVSNAVVTQPAIVTFSTTNINVACNGGSNGSINVSAAGGTSPYTYSDNGGGNYQSGAAFSNIGSGSYTIVVKDANNCLSSSTNVSITQPSAVTFTSTSTNVSCYNGNNGTITVTATGGVGSYSYSNDGGNSYQGSNIISGLIQGTYSVIVKDGNNCVSTPANISITQPTSIGVVINQTNISCNSGNNGQIIVTASGGAGSYTYSNNGGSNYQISNVFASLSAGNYSVVVKDGSICTSTASVTISQPSGITFTTTHLNVSCNGGNNGRITVSASGGAGGYTYSNNGGSSYQAGVTFNNLPAGTYAIVVKDANNCTTGSVNVTVSQPDAVTFSTTQVDIGCAGVGSITVSATGGTTAYTYSNDGGNNYQSSNVFSGLTVDTYTIIVKDHNNCTSSPTDVTLNQVANVSFTSTRTNVSCNGGSNGTITVTGSGGISPYTYSNNNGSTYQSGNVFTGLVAGTYQVIVKDASNCVSNTSNVVVSQPSAVTFTSSRTNVSCNSGSNGSITVTGAGGTSPYTYSNNNGGTYQSSNSFTALAAGTYAVMVKDANNCTSAAGNVVISQAVAVTFTSVSANTSCNGGTNGTITVTAAGGNSPYNYSSNNGGTFQSSNILGGLSASTYSVVVRDVNGCTSAASNVAVSQPTAVSFTSSTTSATCNGGNNGSDTITATGGTPGYTYSKDGGANYQASNTLSSLTAGSYTVVVKDANNCTSSASVSIAQPSAGQIAIPYCTNFITNDCWTVSQLSGVGNWTVTNSMNTGLTPQSANMFVFSSSTLGAGTSSRLQSPVLDFTGVADPVVSWSFANENGHSGSNDSVKVSISTNGGSSFTFMRTAYRYLVSYSTPTWTTWAIDLSPYGNTSNIVLAFDAVSAGGGNDMAIDDICVQASQCPEVVSITTTNITNTTAKVRWVSGGGTPTNYTVRWATSQTGPFTQVTTPNGGSPDSVTITGLTANTTYYWQVKPNCANVLNAGYPIAFNTFTTTNCSSLAINTLTYTVLCPVVSPASPGPVTDTLTATGNFDAWTWSTGATTQSIINSAPGTYTVTATLGGVCTSTSSQVITQACNTPTGEASSAITSTGATISWAAVPCAYSYRVQWRVHGTTTWSVFAVLAPTTSRVFAPGALTANTTYDWNVRSNCNSTASSFSNFSAIQNFTTSGPRGATAANEFSVYPNPASDHATVKFSSTKESVPFSIRLTDLAGRTVMTLDGNTVEGDNQLEMNLDNIAKGIYIVILDKDGISSKLKVSVQ